MALALRFVSIVHVGSTILNNSTTMTGYYTARRFAVAVRYGLVSSSIDVFLYRILIIGS